MVQYVNTRRVLHQHLELMVWRIVRGHEQPAVLARIQWTKTQVYLGPRDVRKPLFGLFLPNGGSGSVVPFVLSAFCRWLCKTRSNGNV